MAEQYKEYVCTLTEASLKKAREELNEDPADRMNAVEAFRNLIKTRAPHIRCSMGKCVCVCVCVCADKTQSVNDAIE